MRTVPLLRPPPWSSSSLREGLSSSLSLGVGGGGFDSTFPYRALTAEQVSRIKPRTGVSSPGWPGRTLLAK